MSIDIAQFAQIFLEEAAEHLASMEANLLGLDLKAADPETLNAIFRSAHSIKGGAGTFGMDAIANFTHTLETLLDRIRHGERTFDEACLDACLRSGDLLREMLDGHADGTDHLQEVADALVAELQALLGDDVASKSKSRGKPKASPATQAQTNAATNVEAQVKTKKEGTTGFIRADVTEQAELATVHRFEVRICLPAAHSDKREVVENLLVSLADLGTLDVFERPSDADEAPCWGVRFETEMDLFALRDFTEFVLEPDWIEITPAQSLQDAPADVTDDPGYGFFEPEPQTEPDEGFGFFADAPGMPPPVPEATDDAATDDAATDDAADGSYGFFAPISAPTASQPAPEPVRVAPVQASRQTTPPSAASAPADNASIRVLTHKIDQLINLVGEMVITQSMLKAAAEQLDPVKHEQLLAGLAQLERNSRDLQESVLSTRMVPMSVVFSRYPRIVRDIAKKLGKQVDLQLIGESVELDKGMVEKIVDPLTHLVRNSLDHGLEMPAQRAATGKKPTGTIMLIAQHQSGQIVIEIVDDGAGLNRDRILDKARAQGMTVDASISDNEVWDLIFAPGFSTAETVTEVSGRGVGMDVVRKNILALGGSVQLSSKAGQGTRVTIRLPLTLAILDGMTVRADNDDFIVPLALVVESLPTDNLSFKSVGRSGRLVRIREDYVPIAPLANLLGMADPVAAETPPVIVVLEYEGRRVAIGVDALLGQQQVVVKNLENNYRRVRGISGATILGNGQVALILDVAGLVDLVNTTHHSSGHPS